MTEYLVILRGIAEQAVTVEADSKAEARDKANEGDISGALGDPDWIDGYPWGRRWQRRASRAPVEVLPDAPAGTGLAAND